MSERNAFLETLGTLWARRLWVGKVMLVATALMMLVWLIRPTTYLAETTLMPIEQDQGVLDMLGGMVDAPGLGAMMQQIGGSTADDRLKNFLNSRTLTRQVIEAQNLMPLIHCRKWDDEKGDWKKPDKSPSLQETMKWFADDVLTVFSGDHGLIHVQVAWPGTADKAAEIANAVPLALEDFINRSSVSVAKKKREFIGQRLDQAKQDLTVAEEKFRTFQEENKLYSFDTQAEAAVQTVSQLQAQLISKDIELGMLRRFTTGSNPRVKLLQNEIYQLRRQIKKLESRQDADPQAFFPALDEAPNLGVQYIRLKRELLIAEKVFELLTQQFELAKIEEARRRTLFQIVDRADVPEKRHSPWWWTHLLAGLLLGLIAAIAAVLFGPALGGFAGDVRAAMNHADRKVSTEHEPQQDD